jgi:hypothetical protein
MAFGLDDVDGAVDDVGREVLDGGEDLGESDMAAGDDYGCVQAALADGEGEVDLDGFRGGDIGVHPGYLSLQDEFRRVGLQDGQLFRIFRVDVKSGVCDFVLVGAGQEGVQGGKVRGTSNAAAWCDGEEVFGFRRFHLGHCADIAHLSAAAGNAKQFGSQRSGSEALAFLDVEGLVLRQVLNDKMCDHMLSSYFNAEVHLCNHFCIPLVHLLSLQRAQLGHPPWVKEV